MTEPLTFLFDDDGAIPNSSLPLLVYRAALPADCAWSLGRSLARRVCSLTGRKWFSNAYVTSLTSVGPPTSLVKEKIALIFQTDGRMT